MESTFEETTHASIAELIQESLETHALLERKDDDAPFVLEAAEAFRGHPSFHVFALGDAQSRPVGFIMTIPGPDQDTVDIGPTFVSTRLRGLGKRMVYNVLKWARECGIRRLVVATWGGNARARHVFETVGFQVTHEEPNTRVNGGSTVYFELDLADVVGGGEHAQGWTAA